MATGICAARRRAGALEPNALPRFSPGIPLYQGAVQTMQALNKLPSLQQRLGGRYRDDAAMPATALEAGSSMVSGGEVWARSKVDSSGSSRTSQPP